MGTGVAGHQITERIADGFSEYPGDTDGQRGTQRVSDPAGVLDGEPTLFAGDADSDRAPCRLEIGQVGGGRTSGRRFVGAEIADGTQQIMRPVDPVYPAILGGVLEFGLDGTDRVRVE